MSLLSPGMTAEAIVYNKKQHWQDRLFPPNQLPADVYGDALPLRDVCEVAKVRLHRVDLVPRQTCFCQDWTLVTAPCDANRAVRPQMSDTRQATFHQGWHAASSLRSEALYFTFKDDLCVVSPVHAAAWQWAMTKGKQISWKCIYFQVFIVSGLSCFFFLCTSFWK